MNTLSKNIAIFSVFSLLVLAGCDNIADNSDIANIDRQIDKVSDHIYSISREGIYYNENIDFGLLNDAKKNTLASIDNLIVDYEESNVVQDQLDEGIGKSTSLLYFIWMEEFDAAWMYNNSNKLLSLQREQAEYNNKYPVKQWLEANDKKANMLKQEEIFNNMIRATNLSKNIDNNEKKLDDLKNLIDQINPEAQSDEYNQKVTEYNKLVEQNQSEIDNYNSIVAEYTPDSIYRVFLEIVDIKILFNGQEQLEFKI